MYRSNNYARVGPGTAWTRVFDPDKPINYDYRLLKNDTEWIQGPPRLAPPFPAQADKGSGCVRLFMLG